MTPDQKQTLWEMHFCLSCESVFILLPVQSGTKPITDCLMYGINHFSYAVPDYSGRTILLK